MSLGIPRTLARYALGFSRRSSQFCRKKAPSADGTPRAAARPSSADATRGSLGTDRLVATPSPVSPASQQTTLALG